MVRGGLWEQPLMAAVELPRLLHRTVIAGRRALPIRALVGIMMEREEFGHLCLDDRAVVIIGSSGRGWT
jgi:hypothetical protein